MVKTLRNYFLYTATVTIIGLFVAGLFIPFVSAAIVISTDHRKPEDNLARIPASFRSIVQFLAPETYVVPRRDSAGKLVSVKISPGALENASSIETTVGYYVVAGIVSANKNSSVSLQSIDTNHKRSTRLCIEPDTITCYPLIDSRSL